MLTILIACGGITGCSAVDEQHSIPEVFSPDSDQAEERLQAGDLYQAKKIAALLLRQDPEDRKSQELMARILDQELALHKAVSETKSPEEINGEEKSLEVRTWLERSRTLTEIGQYDQALAAAEKVFLYDPANAEASGWIDEIRKRAVRAGKKESLYLTEAYQEEKKERIEKYRGETNRLVAQNQWGAAKLAVEKILLLEPEDPEGLRLYEEIRAKARPEGK